MASPVTPTSAFAMYSAKRKSMSPGAPGKNKKKSPVSKGKTITTPMKQVKPLSSAGSTTFSPSVVLNRLDSIHVMNGNSQKKVISTKIKTPNKPKLQEANAVKLSQDIHEKLSTTNDAPKIKKNGKKIKPKIRVVFKTGKKIKQRKKIERKFAKLVCTSPTSQSIEEDGQYKNTIDPVEVANEVFGWLIHPLNIDDFFNDDWEKRPFHINRGAKNYYRNLMSTPMIDDILRQNNILYTKNIDITSYSEGQRETHNPQGRALPSVVWDYYSNGCSVRMLNPQTYIREIHALNAALQELFGCFVGSNFYLTPPGSQGFAPHYDDIEAFILQIEGKKRWRLYKPRNESEYLPRFSSDNFTQSDIGEPILDIVLNAGDMLYFPRGTIHHKCIATFHFCLSVNRSHLNIPLLVASLALDYSQRVMFPPNTQIINM